MRRLMAATSVLLLLAVACTDEPEEPADAETGQAASAADPSSGLVDPFIPDGSVRGVVLGDKAGEHVIEGQRLAFTTDDTSATAFVFLGPDVAEAATVTVTWYAGFGDDRRELFAHEIAAEPGTVAYSEGVAEGGLEPGLYEIEAALDGHRVRTPWVVQSPDSTGGAGGTAATSTLEDWEIPTPGDSGTADWDTPAPPTPAPPRTTCEADAIIAGVDPMRDVTASGWALGPCEELTLSATVSGAPQVIGSNDSPGHTISSVFGAADVCELPGGSDLPGTVVRLEMSGSATATETYTLPDLSSVLIAGLQTTPAEGSRVEPGDQIAIQALAMLMPTAQGVKVLYVDDGSELLESVGNISGSDRPVACDMGRHFANLTTTYEVPDDPPPVVHLCARAEGFEGTSATDCAALFTTDGATWTGTVTATNSGAACEGSEDGTITLTVNGPEVVGSVDASGSYTCSGVVVPTSGSVILSGTLDDAGFALSVETLEGTLLSTVLCLVNNTFQIPVVGDSAQARVTNTAPSGDVYACDFELRRQA